jgi:hypothetical protein
VGAGGADVTIGTGVSIGTTVAVGANTDSIATFATGNGVKVAIDTGFKM